MTMVTTTIKISLVSPDDQPKEDDNDDDDEDYIDNSDDDNQDDLGLTGELNNQHEDDNDNYREKTLTIVTTTIKMISPVNSESK